MSVAELEPRTIDSSAGAMMPAKFSVEQFDAMIEAGIFPASSEEKIQLLRGEVVLMSPPNPLHDDVVNLLNIWANSGIVDVKTHSPHCQTSLALSSTDSVVIPDIKFVQSKPYDKQHPTVADTFLLIEVSDTSLSYDLGDKMRLYAEAGVREYWVVDIPNRSLVVHLDPTNGRYRSVQTLDEHEAVQCKTLPNVSLVTSTLFR